jgi:dinuclear metal center YbgI/SA1388 family protein
VPKLKTVIEVLDELYDPRTAQDWDAVGLVCGDPDADIGRVLFAVDPVRAVVEEAIAWRADLVVTHHPLFLRGVHGVPATTPKGKIAHSLIRHDIALHVCHTNADAARPGVSDALAKAVGLATESLRPIEPDQHDPTRGIGRIGVLPQPETLEDFRQRVAAALPPTAHGVRVAGDPTRTIQTVAVSGGAGDSYLAHVRKAGVDAYLTADLRHHPSSELREHDDAPALLDVAHWASEWPWLADAAERLVQALQARGTTVEAHISTVCTDPWREHIPSQGGSEL